MSVYVLAGDTAESRLTLAQLLIRRQPMRSVYSNIPLTCPADGTIVTLFDSLDDLADVQDAFIFLDDAADWFPSFTDRTSRAGVFSLLGGSRLHGTTWFLSVPSFECLDVAVRQVATFVYECRPLLPKWERVIGPWHIAEMFNSVDRNISLSSKLFRTESYSCPSM